MKNRRLHTNQAKGIIAVVIAGVTLLLVTSSLIHSTPTNAKASPVTQLSNYAIDCNSVVDVYGKAETTLNVNTEGRYRLWVKLRSANPSADSFYVNVDGSCFVMGNNTNTENWTWVDYVSGSNDRKFDLDVTSGSLKLEFYAREKGVQLDKVQLIGDTARCETNYRNGSDCENSSIPENNIVKDVNIIGLVEGATIHTATIVQAEPHPSLDVNSVKFYINGAGVRTDGSSPYCMQGARAENCKAYDFTTLSELGDSETKSHKLTVEVTTSNAGVFSKDLNFNFSKVMHSGTAIDLEQLTVAEESPEIEDSDNQEKIIIEENTPVNNVEPPSNEDDETQENTQQEITEEEISTSPSNQVSRDISSSLNDTTATMTNNQALVTDTSKPILIIDNILSSDILLLNGQIIPTKNTINFNETGRNVLSVSDSNGNILKEYVVVIRYPDYDGDGKIGSSDLRKIILNWRTSNDRYDLNGDAVVNSIDIRILINKWSEQL